jgi:hypothetical protein
MKIQKNCLIKNFPKAGLIFLLLITACLVFAKNVKAGLNTDYVEMEVTYKKPDGEECEAASDCSSDNCIDGYCCDTACTGSCEACNISGSEGTCSPCPAGTAYSTGGCSSNNYCNTWALCSCRGTGCYNDGGNTYTCQAQCDGSNNCNYAANCYIKRSGYCYLEKADDNSQIVIKWTDDSDSESGYDVDINTDSGGWTDLTTEAADSVSYTDTCVSSGHTYQYRVRPTFSDGSFGTWCFTAELNLGTGDFKIN